MNLREAIADNDAARYEDWFYALEVISRDSGETIDFSSIAEVIAEEEGENDGNEWIAVAILKDGRVAHLSAGCDYTGWG
jgi:hypothetical protein